MILIDRFPHRLCLYVSILLLAIPSLSSCAAHSSAEQAPEAQPVSTATLPYRGWAHLVGKLKERGVPQEKLEAVFNDARMPEFSLITFKLKPIESSSIYQKFRTVEKLKQARAFLEKHRATFDKLRKISTVDPEIVTAILLVETHFGENTGKDMILNRLARVCSVGESDTLGKNYELIRKENPRVTIEQVRERATYLEDTFLPELVALFTMAEKGNFDIFSLKGSPAGAFGIPQFLPSSFLICGKDGDGDGTISLYNIYDAIFSTANFLTHYGWKPGLNEKQKRAIVWNYNHSQAYVDTIFWLAAGMAHRRM